MKKFLLQVFSGRPALITEARASIRESLRVFSRIEEHCEHNKHELQMFERLVGCRGKGSSSSVMDEMSCGLTNSSFGSLIFSTKQLNQNSVSLHTNGSSIEQLYNNPNIFLFGMGWTRKGSLGANSQFLSRYSVNSAEMQVRAWEQILTQHDEAEALPRVLFCNCSWVLNDTDIVDGVHDSEYVKDHQFSIIKHGNDNFQCVQGYKQTTTEGFCLSTWQQSQSHYSSRKGFSKEAMKNFARGLGTFALADFDSVSFERLFGIYETSSHGHKVLPCFSWRELEDASIEGHGERAVCAEVEKHLVE